MSTSARSSLGFEAELDELDPAAWATSNRAASNKPKTIAAREVAEASGFRSREPARAVQEEEVVRQRRRRTGRNVQFNIKTRAETIAAFCAIADQKGWGIGETFEHATELLAKAIKPDKQP